MIKELHDMAVSYDEAFAAFEEKIEDARREWCASILSAYPFKAELDQVAHALRQDLDASEVEVNSISRNAQTTIAKAPPNEIRIIPVKESLCVLSVGAGLTAQVSDVLHDPFLKGHAVSRSRIGSWTSAPIKIAGVDAGTVCALELDHARVWGEAEREILESTAARIGELVSDWASHTNLRSLL